MFIIFTYAICISFFYLESFAQFIEYGCIELLLREFPFNALYINIFFFFWSSLIFEGFLSTVFLLARCIALAVSLLFQGYAIFLRTIMRRTLYSRYRRLQCSRRRTRKLGLILFRVVRKRGDVAKVKVCHASSRLDMKIRGINLKSLKNTNV